MPKERLRKRNRAADTRPTRSRRFAAIATQVDRHDFAGALTQINSELPASADATERGKWMRQVARSLYKRGRFTEASQAFAQAGALTATAGRDWLDPQLSRIRSLVKDVSLADAEAAARDCYQTAISKGEEFRLRRAGAAAEFAATGKVVVPLKPHRPSVVASELGGLFLSEGELTTAKTYFELAVKENPRGGTRARQGLAEIALRMDDPQTAFQRSVEALTLGKFQAKTVASWKPFFAAKRKLGQTGLAPEFLASLKACQPGVRARATLTIARELRSGSDPQWKSIASEWLASDASSSQAVAAELRKMLLSDTKQKMSDPSAQIATARALLDTPQLANHEWLTGAKELVRASLFAGTNPNISQLITRATRLYGQDFIPQLRHSLALSCMVAQRHDLARPILMDAISGAKPGSHIWSKANWALGMMESKLKNPLASAQAFRSIAQSPVVPQRFRLQARMLWAENLVASGDKSAIQQCAKDIQDLLGGVKDYDVLLNFARQLSNSDKALRPLATKFFTQGETLALEAFAAATHPSAALDILFKVARRQVYDFGRSKATIEFWNSLPEQKKLWLWNNDNRWWSYIAFVLMAYLRVDDLKSAAQLAKSTLDDPATPREALPTVLVPYYGELMIRGYCAEALAAFEWIVTENPTKAGCATAYYWLALDAYRRGDKPAVATLCEGLLAANAHTEVNYERWMLEAQARLLLVDLDPTRIPTQVVKFDSKWIEDANRQLRSRLKILQR